jgi:hypothetical protein
MTTSTSDTNYDADAEDEVKDRLFRLGVEYGFGTLAAWVLEGWSSALVEDGGLSKEYARQCAVAGFLDTVRDAIPVLPSPSKPR